MPKERTKKQLLCEIEQLKDRLKEFEDTEARQHEPSLDECSFADQKKQESVRRVHINTSSIVLPAEALNRMNSGIVLIRQADQEIFFANPRVEEIFGYSAAELMGKNFSILIPNDESDADSKAKEIMRDAGENSSWINEIYLALKTGEKIWTKTRILLSDHEEYGNIFVCLMDDFSRLKVVEYESKIQRLLLEKAQMIARLGHWKLNLKTNETVGSEALYRIYEMECGKKPIADFTRLVHEEDREYFDSVFERAISQGESWDFEYRIRTAQGNIVWAHAMGEVVLDDEGRALELIGTVQDISVHKSLHRTLESVTHRLNEAERIAKIGSWELDIASGKLIWSDEVYRIFELNPGEFEATYERFLEAIHPDDRERVNLAYLNSLETKEFYTIEHRLLLAEGRIKYVREHCETAFDDEGNALCSLGTVQDITLETLAEQERVRLQKQLLIAQRMEAIGTLAGGIAHDFNNILTPIIGYTDMVLSEIPETDPISESLRIISDGANRAKALIRQILLFSKQVTNENELVNLKHVMTEVIDLLRMTIPSSIGVKTEWEDPVAQVLGDATQLHQILVNLCSNAVQAMEGDGNGTLTIKANQVSLSDSEASKYVNLKAENYVCLQVSDTGSGIDQEILEYIFDPFFTTKQPHKGTGLGLSVVHGIVASHNGEIVVDSVVGQGTTFSIYLPVARGE